MFSDTHQLIAANVFEIVKSELDIELDYDSLRYGSILPDIHPFLTFIPHSMEGSIDMLEKRVNDLENSYFGKREIKRLSIRLGIIIHFISDYFCKAHNEKKYSNIYLHYIYESKLKKFFRRCIKSNRSFEEDYVPGPWEISGDIRSFIEKKHDEYNSTRHCMKNDILFSMEVSLMVALNVVSRNVKNVEGTMVGNPA